MKETQKNETVKLRYDHSLRADVINIYFPYTTTKLFNSPDETCKFSYGSPLGHRPLDDIDETSGITC